MRVRLSDPTLFDDLRTYLARRACVVRRTRGQTVEVDLPEATDPAAARRELELYLASWRVGHGDVVVDVDDDAPQEPPAPAA